MVTQQFSALLTRVSQPRLRVLGWLALWLALTGCYPVQSGSAEAELKPEVLYQSAICNEPQPQRSSVLINRPEALQRWYQQAQKHQLGGKKEPPQVDFERASVVAYHLGSKPTTGYSVAIDLPQVALQGTELIIPVIETEPEAGAFAGQMLTSPCILLKVDQTAIKQVTFVDQAHSIVHQLKVTN